MLVHVVTLALGLIIAFGLQQIVALFQRRRRERAQEQQASAAADPTSPDESA